MCELIPPFWIVYAALMDQKGGINSQTPYELQLTSPNVRVCSVSCLLIKVMGLIIAIHVIICALLIGIILVQAGRGGGLIEGFSGVESMFGTKTNTFLSRTTTILSILFFLTCVSLAFLSVKQSRSLMRDIKPKTTPQTTAPISEPTEQVTPQTPKPGEETPAAQTEMPQKESTQNTVEQKKPQEVPKTE